jgi:hypothetical protein
MVELQLVMYIIQIVMLKLVGVMDKRQVVMYNLWVIMRKTSRYRQISCRSLYTEQK